jgi:hypothetical protein
MIVSLVTGVFADLEIEAGKAHGRTTNRTSSLDWAIKEAISEGVSLGTWLAQLVRIYRDGVEQSARGRSIFRNPDAGPKKARDQGADVGLMVSSPGVDAFSDSPGSNARDAERGAGCDLDDL